MNKLHVEKHTEHFLSRSKVKAEGIDRPPISDEMSADIATLLRSALLISMASIHGLNMPENHQN